MLSGNNYFLGRDYEVYTKFPDLSYSFLVIKVATTLCCELLCTDLNICIELFEGHEVLLLFIVLWLLSMSCHAFSSISWSITDGLSQRAFANKSILIFSLLFGLGLIALRRQYRLDKVRRKLMAVEKDIRCLQRVQTIEAKGTRNT
jgi:hypothetical protein